jgi:carbon monoxide dehydrogenase subunit G
MISTTSGCTRDTSDPRLAARESGLLDSEYPRREPPFQQVTVISSNDVAGSRRAGGNVKVEGSYQFDAPPDRVWSVLLDPESLKSCIPGCEAMNATGEDQYEATLKVGVAAIRGTYKSKVRITEKQEPSSYKMLVEGTGGAGFVRGEALVELAEQGGATQVSVHGDGQVGGTVAGVGQRMLGGVAKMLMGQFFECLKKQL